MTDSIAWRSGKDLRVGWVGIPISITVTPSVVFPNPTAASAGRFRVHRKADAPDSPGTIWAAVLGTLTSFGAEVIYTTDGVADTATLDTLYLTAEVNDGTKWIPAEGPIVVRVAGFK